MRAPLAHPEDSTMFKPIKLDWDQLEEAFNNKNDELVYYLDTVTGHVHLEGEDEDGDDQEAFDTRPPAPGQPRRTNDPTRKYLEPPTTALKVEWLAAFVEQDGFDAEIATALRGAMVGDDPGPAIREVLNANPDVRDDWYVYRSERIRVLLGEWLKKSGIKPTDPPPWDS